MSLKTTLEALGNQVRRLSGKTNKMSLDAMTQALSNVSLGADVSGADASASQVLSGKKFVGANGTLETGSMTNNGSVSATLNTSTKSYTVPAGYHSGSGKVSITTQEKSVTPSTYVQTVTPDSGKVLSKVTVAAASGGSAKRGTATVREATEKLTINTYTTLSSSSTFFLMFTGTSYDPVITGDLITNTITCAVKSPQENLVTSLYANEYDGTLYPTVYNSTGEISFSGTSVTINAPNCNFIPGTYTWFLM